MSTKYDLFFQCYPPSHSHVTNPYRCGRQSSDHRNNLPHREIGSSVLGARLNNLRHTRSMRKFMGSETKLTLLRAKEVRLIWRGTVSIHLLLTAVVRCMHTERTERFLRRGHAPCLYMDTHAHSRGAFASHNKSCCNCDKSVAECEIELAHSHLMIVGSLFCAPSRAQNYFPSCHYWPLWGRFPCDALSCKIWRSKA
jgi:hypothetical protein